MNALLKSATIVDSKSEFHNETVDVLIEKGRISKISKRISKPDNARELRLENLHISPGWFDSSVSFGEPGYEERETISNGLATAAKSGFTGVVLNANSNPVLDSYADITLVKTKAAHSATQLYPLGALTQGSNGLDLAELYDMKNAGAVGFYDYQKPIKNPDLLKIALQYASSFDGLVYSFPQNPEIAGSGVVNEHINSTRLGLKGIPGLAEELQIARDLFLLEYTNGKLHIPTISTSKSVDLIREAKRNKLDVSCSVAIHNLFFDDNILSDFDTNYKVLPPLRTKTDCEALIEGLKDGTIDMVTSDHNPIDIEHKKIEFDYALFGTIGLESAFSALQTLFTTKKTISLLTSGKPRFGLENNSINIGKVADLSLFNPEPSYKFNQAHIHSSSKNSVFLDQNLKGKVYGIIYNTKMVLN
jgi:dihydroorotase